MYLYNLTLQRATGITHAVHGNFSGSKMQEILVSRGKSLELLRPDPNTGKVHTLLTVEVFGIIRSLMAFRLTGGTKDYIVVGSDSGRIVILEYIPAKNTFEKVHQETFGKSGCRRIVPGQYLAIDPKGRAVMIGTAYHFYFQQFCRTIVILVVKYHMIIFSVFQLINTDYIFIIMMVFY